MWVRFGKNDIYTVSSVHCFIEGARTLIQSYDSSAPSGLEPLVCVSVLRQQRVELQQQRDSQQQQLLQLVQGSGRLRIGKN